MKLISTLLLPFLLSLEYLFLILYTHSMVATGVSWTSAQQWHHPLSKIEDEPLQMLAADHDSHQDDFNRTLDTILMPRVPDTETHTLVRQNILKQLNALNWYVTQDQFSERTPHGRKNFANIIATYDPRACRNLVIACHYDSKYNREYTFLGATDSAVPCAMMIHAARMLNPLLQKQKTEHPNPSVTLQLIFFDGEEAFRRWSRTDSLYGSRHLAEKWNKSPPFDNNVQFQNCKDRDYVSYLDRMDLMVLLDLIGGAHPKFYSYFPDTLSLYNQFASLESRLNSMKMLQGHPPETSTSYFTGGSTLAFIEDDHVPFMKRGVPILHVIPSPFPSVWHRETDNRANLHHPTISNLNKILRAFIVQYLHLEVPKEPIIL